ncbi:hypothetical protein FRC15_010292 [Serendipita sp. 397]|nr:hypothetical protein FRC15_010292 [Serendipita sp. 397]
MSTSVSGSSVGSNRSSPVKPNTASITSHIRSEWSKFIYPHRNTEISKSDMKELMCPVDYNDKDWIRSSDAAPEPLHSDTAEEYVDYLNMSTASLCRPDIVAYKQQNPQRFDEADLNWSHLETTGEIYSKKESKAGTEAQAGAYTAYHLQARPDRVSVSGIWLKKEDKTFQLFITSACQVYHTSILSIKDHGAPSLFFAFVWSLYYPDVDPSISINTNVPLPTFTVRVSDQETYSGLKVSFTGDAIGRRTTIMTRNGLSATVIKEQYIEDGRRFNEGELLDIIHEKGVFPGVVRVGTYGPVEDQGSRISIMHKPDGHRAIVRYKTRLVLKDKGILLSKVKTIRQLLMCCYDLLEVIRNADKHRGILHRDISSGNVLVRSKHRSDNEPFAKDLGDMCFCKCLLAQSKDDSDGPSLKEKFDTDLLLTDFDSAEDKNRNNPEDSRVPKARTGTPIFMARMVRNTTHFQGIFRLPVILDVHEDVLSRYEKLYPDRVQDFPKQSRPELVEVPPNQKVDPTEFQHKQCYDAESVFWYLVWWSLLASPAYVSPNEPIPPVTWSSLTGAKDSRHFNFILPDTTFDLHSAYSEFASLLEEMRTHLIADLQFSKDPIKHRPDYLTEVFQRLILNFLIENKDKRFMVLKKSDTNREVELAAGGGAVMSKTPASGPATYASLIGNSVRSSTNVSLANKSSEGSLPPGSNSSTHGSNRGSPFPVLGPKRAFKKATLKKSRINKPTTSISTVSSGTKRGRELDELSDEDESEAKRYSRTRVPRRVSAQSVKSSPTRPESGASSSQQNSAKRRHIGE